MLLAPFRKGSIDIGRTKAARAHDPLKAVPQIERKVFRPLGHDENIKGTSGNVSSQKSCWRANFARLVMRNYALGHKSIEPHCYRILQAHWLDVAECEIKLPTCA